MLRVAALLSAVAITALLTGPATATTRTVSGRVYDSATGAGLAGVTVRTFRLGLAATTDAAGRYALSLDDGSDWDLTVNFGALPYMYPSPTFVHVPAGTGNVTIDFPLVRAYTLKGIVRHPDGSTANASVAAYRAGPQGCCSQAAVTYFNVPNSGFQLRVGLGTYRLEARDESPGYWGARTWSGDASNFATAADVVVAGDTTGVVLTVRPNGLNAAPSTTSAGLLALVNDLRASVGVGPLERDTRLEAAAAAHARYISAYGVTDYETPGRPEYTGATPQERAAVQGFGGMTVSEVAITNAPDYAGILSLWTLPYHRLGLFHPHAALGGFAYNSEKGARAVNSLVGNLAFDWGVAAPDFVLSPADGETGVPTTFNGGFEIPAACGSGGFPVMLIASYGRSVALRGAEIRHARSGQPLAFTVAKQLYEQDYVALCPQAYSPATTYHVRFDLTVGSEDLTREWNFTTSADGRWTYPSLHAAYRDQSPYALLNPGEEREVSVRYMNVGQQAWERGISGRQVTLGVRGDDLTFSGLASGWPSPNRVAVQEEQNVGFGELGTFRFRVRGPSTPGTYDIPLVPVVEGVRWLEDHGVFVRVIVPGPLRSKWLSQSANPSVSIGQETAVSLTFRNAGTATWVKGSSTEVRLGVVNDDRMFANLGMAVGWPLPERPSSQAEASVLPGGTATFTFRIRGVAAGEYILRLRPVVDGVSWLDDEGVFLVVTVRS